HQQHAGRIRQAAGPPQRALGRRDQAQQHRRRMKQDTTPEPNAVAADTYDVRELTFGKVIARFAATVPDKTYLTELATGRTFSYPELDAWTDRIAHALAGFGVGQGAHVGVLLGNCAEHLALFYALGKRGAVSVPVNTAARGELLRYYLGQSDCECV